MENFVWYGWLCIGILIGVFVSDVQQNIDWKERNF